MKLPKKALTWGLILLLLALIIATIILGSVPPVDRDALTHHLFVPKLWLKHGGIYEIPEIPFSYYPMNLDLLYTISLYFGNDIIPKYIHYFFALLTALLLYRHLNKRLGVHYGLLGALFFLSVPIIVKLSITVYVDLGVVFFTTASLLLLLHWAEQNFEWRSLVLAGLCCGLAAGTKYNGLISIVVLTLFVPIIYQQNTRKEKQSNGKALLWGCVFGMTALTSFSPWLIRNYAWTGNPIYPLHNSLFQKFRSTVGEQQTDVPVDLGDALQQVTSKGSGAFISRKILYNETWQQALLLPLRFFYEGQDDNPQFFDGKLTPFLIVLPILAFLFRPPDTRQRWEQKILLTFALLYFLLTFFQEALRIRYIAPIVPPLVILSIYGLQGATHKASLLIQKTGAQKTALHFAAFCLSGSMLWNNGQYIAAQVAIVNPLPYLLGKESRDEYITTFRPEYPAIQYANAFLPPDAKVLCIFLGNRGYYMDFQPVFEQPFGEGVFSKFLKREYRETGILETLNKKNFTYVLMREDLTKSWLESLNDKDRLTFFPFMLNANQALFSQNGYNFFSLK
ncbi:MAG: phospholipid carrier-dependent glycosyltransferase [Desulfobulbus sp.]|nr:phospholipid carrier-dependent glycosyltransferase [Desulfobulbus sp.]